MKQNGQIMVWLSLLCGHFADFLAEVGYRYFSFFPKAAAGPWVPHADLVLTWGGTCTSSWFNQEVSFGQYGQTQSILLWMLTSANNLYWLNLVALCGLGHTHTHTHIYADTRSSMPTHHKEACCSRAFEVCLSWSSYVTGDTDPSLHAKPFVMEPLWCLSSLRSASLLRPGLNQCTH